MVGGWVGPPGSPEVSSLVLEKKFRAPLEWIHGALSRIQFTTHFIKNSVVEMKRFVGSFENVISCTAALQTQVPKLCTDLDLSLLYILIFGTCTKFARKNNFLALGDCFPQPCSSAGRRFAASRSRLQNYRRIVSFPQKKNRWNVLETGFHWESAFVWEIPNPTLWWGWIFLKQTRILSGIQSTTHFIHFFVAKTNWFVGSFVNVILTRQTCGPCSSRAAQSNRRALDNYFPEWICYMFLVPNWRGDWNLGWCTFWVLAKRETLRNAKFRFFLRAKHVSFSEVVIGQQFFVCKYPKSAPT